MGALNAGQTRSFSPKTWDYDEKWDYEDAIAPPSNDLVLPAYQSPGDYQAPEYDEGRVNELTQTSAAGSVRGLRSAMQKVSGASYDNPNVKRMTLRDALAGYGEGLQSAMSKASDTARNLYNTEYNIKSDEAKTNYQEDVSASRVNYEAKTNEAAKEYETAWNTYWNEKNYGLEKNKQGLAEYTAEKNYEIEKENAESAYNKNRKLKGVAWNKQTQQTEYQYE
jgi:hypothetical protein